MAPDEAPEPAAAPERTKHTAVSIELERITIDGKTIVAARPASAPGIVAPDLRATYAYPELVALGRDRTDARAAAEVPIATVRGVWTSMVAAGSSGTLAIEEGEPVTLHRAGDRAPTAYVRPRRGGWELRLDFGLRARVDDLADLGAAVAGLDPKALERGVALDLPDDAPVEDLVAAARMVEAAAPGTPAVLAIDYDPCVTPPEGMVCVPGGPAIVGYDDGLPEEAPEREIVLSTFYMDRYEVTNAQYDECHAAGACRIRINRHEPIMKPFVGEDQPAMPMDWHRARAYCAWKGKRLPTEWEWEKAARGPDGDLFPWGNDPPSCDKAIYRECAPHDCTPYPGKEYRWDCNEHATKKVGSFPAGHYGLHDMAGNGYEWTSSVGVASVAECGDACNGRDPLGPCDGAFPCKTTRILRGGSWYWPKHRMRGSHRRPEQLETGSHRLGMRCATAEPFLTAWPPMHVAQARERPPDPEPPTPEELAIVAAVEDDPIQQKPICDEEVRENWGSLQAEGGRSEITCRDPFPYLMSNEPRGHHWVPYIENIGGAYVGIGSDQNYSHIAIARALWAWVVDYDPRVYANHLRLRALVMAAERPADFVALFTQKGDRKAIRALQETYPDRHLESGYYATRDKLHAYFIEQMQPNKAAPDFGWLRNEEHYAYVRTMFEQGRLRPVAGDLLGASAMTGIAAAAKRLGVPVRVFYTSNAPSSWGGQITEEYRRNVLALPFDEWSVVLQTNSKGGFRQSGKWHHNITWGRTMHERLRRPGYSAIWMLLEGRIPGHHGDVTILGLPSGGPR